MRTKAASSPTLHQGDKPKGCNLCGGRAHVILTGTPTIVRCDECGLLSLADFPGAAERQSHYQEEYYSEDTGERFLGIFELAVLFFRWLRMRSIRRRVPGPASLLDVGCGRGVLLELFHKRGWRVLGTQVSRTAAEAARRRRGVEVVCGDLPEISLPRGAFQVITFFHVLEHLDRPAEFLIEAHKLLSPDGLLVVEVPNCASPGFAILGLRNFCVDYPHHLLFFTPHSLAGLLDRAGFTVEKVAHFSLEYSPYTTLQNLLNLLPGFPNRFYKALMRNDEGRRLRRSPWTVIHAVLACVLALPALFLSLAGLILPVGNTMRFYCRKR